MTHARLYNRRLAGLLLFLASFALYLRTLAPTVAELFDDSLEFQLAGFRLAIAHPTGYPLYLLLLKGFTLLPLGEVAGRANLASACFAALAVTLVYAVTLQLTDSIPAALISGAALATSPVFWSQAVIAEVYALNAVFVAAISLWMARFARYAENLVQRGQPTFPALAFLFGLALTHHRSIILLAPAVALALLVAYARRWSPLLRRVANLSTLMAFLAPLLLYLYLPLRGAVGSPDGTYQNTLDGFFGWVTASTYNIFLTGNPFNEHYDAPFFVNLFMQQLGWFGIALCIAGVAALWVRRNNVVATYWLIAFVTFVLFVVNYRVPDVQVFAIPAFLLMAVLIGTGAQVAGDALVNVGERVGVGSARNRRGFAAVVLLLLLALNFVPMIPVAFTQNDRSDETAIRDMGRDWLAEPFPPNARLVGILGEMTLVRYLQAAEGRQPTLVTIAADRDAERMTAIEAGFAADGPVFTTRPLEGLAAQYSLGAFGPLVRVWPSPPRGELAQDAPQVAGIRYRLDGVTQPYPTPIRVQLTWQTTTPISDELKVSARLLDSERVIAQHDDWPVYNAYHTVAWRVGESIHDAYAIRIPRGTPPGAYQVLLIVYRAESGAEVGRIDGGSIILTENR
jgi:hypothetical protein